MTRSSSPAYWQAFTPTPVSEAGSVATRMPDGSWLTQPLRDMGETAIAGLILNQASFVVFDRIAGWVAGLAASHAPDVVVGLPTLGHGLAAAVARALGHGFWVAAGSTRKFWYDPALSEPLSSITAPGGSRRLWLDPRMLPVLQGRRVLLVDDVISTGSSARAGVALLARIGCRPVALCVAMAQGDRWRAGWQQDIPVRAAFATPLYRRGPDGWREDPATCATGL